MSLEYAIKGVCSMKSDVFSFGVLLLEIVSGKKNYGCYHSELPLNLTGLDEYLCSANKIFRLQFFSIGASNSYYLGIFYNRPPKTRNFFIDYTLPVWVANTDTPAAGLTVMLLIDSADGLLKLSYDQWDITVSDCSPTDKNTTATILDNGNLVLRMHNPDGSINRTMWQSFDYPTDTLLPGMKLGINFKTGHNWSLTPWTSKAVPASGSFALRGDPNGSSQLMLWWQGGVYWTSGLWEKGNFNNTHFFGVDFNFAHVSNENEKYLTYSQKDSISFNLQQVRIDSNGVIHFVGRSAASFLSFCSVAEDQDPGCVHVMERQNCSCIAFTLKNNGNRAMCEIFNNVKRFTPFEEHREVLYSLDTEEARRRWAWIVGAVMGTILLMIFCYFIWKGKEMTEEKMLLQELADTNVPPGQYSGVIDKIGKKMKNQVQVFSFQNLEMATDNFSNENKLGEGGFGSVYKGKLPSGQEIAIKRLSRSSGQGVLEFKNEILLIAKLQHDNLFKLLGCCIKGKEKILVYEFMPNRSLDFFLFDSSRRESIKWTNRMNIIQGVAQGLLYLHKYSRLRVIHQDLKASNILLDQYMNPKISDFGMARIFGKQESEANTKRIVGTHGYMSPEYAIKGIFSVKSDVFSFGVLLLETVTGKKNHGCYHSERPLNLIGLIMQLIGPSMMDVVSMLANESVLLPKPKQPAFFIETSIGYAAKEVEVEKPCTNDLTFSVMDGR
ncbi:lectin protein kinase family protein [Perilla frutescens var. frutescens]|nr:lectin protein kinase family protein [Perilla frutescens var. frutescens]